MSAKYIMLRYQLAVIVLAASVLTAAWGDPLPLPGSSESTYSYLPPEGYVPDATTARSIAEAIWIPIYGKKLYDSQRPMIAFLANGIWTVKSSSTFIARAEDGMAEIKVSQKQGRVLQCLNDTPVKGYVPDAKTAKLIAEAIWVPIYGKTLIDSEKPFIATLKDGVWIVEGAWNFPKDDLGGTAKIKISQNDCLVLQCLHGQ